MVNVVENFVHFDRLGDAEKAIDHYKQSGRKVDKKDIAEAHDIKRQLLKCTEAQKLRDYKTLLKETQNSITLGVDSAPQVSLQLRPHLFVLGGGLNLNGSDIRPLSVFVFIKI